LAPTFKGSHWEENDGRIWIEYYVLFYFRFFLCNLGRYYTKINISPLSFIKKRNGSGLARKKQKGK
jgi:hypothetical protein